MILILSLLLWSCEPKPEPEETGEVQDTGSGDTGETSPPENTDEDLLRALMAEDSPGTSRVEEVLSSIALSDGLPVRTRAGTFLFACACGSDDWSVAGDFDGWSGTPLTRNGSLHWAEVSIDAPQDSYYKLWDGGATWAADAWARRYTYDSYGEISLVRASAPHLERWPLFQSAKTPSPGGWGPERLEPRTLRVWVPQDGAFDRVLFAHDGQNLFDPDAMWGGWHLQDSVPDGILVVGIDNTWERDWEYTHVEDFLGDGWYGGGGDTYADFVQDQVRPFIAEKYGDASLHGLLGSSLGGLISFHVAGRHDGAWDFAASLSGTFGWGSIGADNPTLIQIFQDAGHRGTALYLDSGGGPDCPGSDAGACADRDGDGTMDDVSLGDNYCETVQMRDTLAAAGYVYEEDLWHWHEPCAEHNEMAWAARVSLPLQVFAGL